ncbi:MAG TPA: DUF4336 domain-containing protein [Nannocystaceae bacterium]|nr:DUF4336 domain-containing protein [Nannocystaceae bacterium]
MLERLDDALWVAAAPQTFLGMHLGTRMTIVRRDDGGLVVHSPIALDDRLRGEVDALGPVRCVIAPSLFHHLYVGEWIAAFPDVRLVGPKKLADKREDLKLDATLAETPDPAWQGTLDQVRIRGCMLQETVFFHPPSRTLISADLIENFESSPHWPTRMYLKMSGVHGKPGVSRPVRWTFRDHEQAKLAIERVLLWDFQRLVLAHGNVIEAHGPQVVRESYAWL